MAVKIDKKIVGYSVQKEEEAKPADTKTEAKSAAKATSADNVVHLTEKLERPEMLLGSTYKVKTPLTEHALYITVNDIILNP
ncbi:MAG: NrdJb, partial [Gammaproteobacteria bacterium]|nr:NrdJb [Gammaproteobacteria bacterium]